MKIRVEDGDHRQVRTKYKAGSASPGQTSGVMQRSQFSHAIDRTSCYCAAFATTRKIPS